MGAITSALRLFEHCLASNSGSHYLYWLLMLAMQPWLICFQKENITKPTYLLSSVRNGAKWCKTI